MQRRLSKARSIVSVLERSRVVHAMCVVVGALAAACATAEAGGGHPTPDAGNGGANPGGSGGIDGTGGIASGGSAANGGGSAGMATAGGSAGSAGAGTGGSTCSGSAGAPAGSAGAAAFFDDFEDGNAAGWIRSPNTAGDWAVACDGGWVYRQSTLAATLHVSAVTSTTYTDQIVEARVKVLSFGGGAAADGVGVYARFKDLNNYYYVDLRNDGRVAIRMVVSGASTTLPNTAVDAGITTGQWYTIRLSAIGSALEAFVDGASVASTTDTSIAEGGFAVGATNATAEFDDVRVTVP